MRRKQILAESTGKHEHICTQVRFLSKYTWSMIEKLLNKASTYSIWAFGLTFSGNSSRFFLSQLTYGELPYFPQAHPDGHARNTSIFVANKNITNNKPITFDLYKNLSISMVFTYVNTNRYCMSSRSSHLSRDSVCENLAHKLENTFA